MTRKEYNKSVDDYSDNLFRFALKLSGNRQAADDLVQESYTRLWQKVEEVDPLKAKSYLFSTLYNYFIDQTRKNKRMADNEYVSVGFEDHSQYSDLNEILNKALKILPEIQKTVILLRDYEGYSYQEIGEITKLKESQVKVYIFRARKTLRNYLVKIDYVI